MTKEDKTEDLKPVAMFGDRENIKEAFDYAMEVMRRSTDPSMEIYGTTALLVVWNTLANKYEPRKLKEDD